MGPVLATFGSFCARSDAAAAGEATGRRQATDGLMDDSFLMKLSQHELTSDEQLQLCVYLKMDNSTIEEIRSEGGLSNLNITFKLLQKFRNSAKNVGNSTPLCNQLSKACLDLKRADLVEYVRTEQSRHLNERLQKERQATLSCREKHNVQMLLVKKKLQGANENIRQLMSANKKSEEEIRRLNNLVIRNQPQRTTVKDVRKPNEQTNVVKTSPKTSNSLTAIRIQNLTKATESVTVENDKEIALQIMAKLVEYEQPELWEHVSWYFVKEGQMNMRSVLTSTTLPSLVYLLSSGAASDISSLDLGYNDVFAKENAGQSLGNALASTSDLYELIMSRCKFSVQSWCHIGNGLSRGCRQMQRLNFFNNGVFAQEEAGRSLGSALAVMSELCELRLRDCQLTLKSWRHIADGVSQGCPCIQLLQLDGNTVFAKEDAGLSLETALSSMSQLSDLQMTKCELSLEAWRHIADGLSQGCRELKELHLNGNTVFAKEEAGRTLEAAMSSVTQLCDLRMYGCDVTLPSWCHVVDGISKSCPQMTCLDCRQNKLTDDSEEAFRMVLSQRPGLTIYARDNAVSSDCASRLQLEFAGRFDTTFQTE